MTSAVHPGPYTVSYSDGWDIANGAYWFTNVAHPGRPDVKTWYDILGREIKQQTEHYNNQSLISSQTYNSRGALETATRAKLATEPAFTTTYSYNDYGQVTSEVNPYGATSYDYSYSGGNTTVQVTNPAGQNSSTVTDAAGRVLSATDNGGTLKYTYDSRGNVLVVKQGIHPLVINTYDDYGRKTKMLDCDAGLTTYGYDAWDRLANEKDANNNQHAFAYNVMGMLVNRYGPEGATNYSYYGTFPGATNKLESVTGFNGVNETYHYDLLGRPKVKSKTIGSRTFETYYNSYNVYGDVLSISFSSGFSYTNEYDHNGFLTKVKSSYNGTTPLFSAGSIDGNGRYTSYTLGNGKTSTNTYYHDFPVSFSTPGVQNLVMNYDHSSGNLLERTDYKHDLTEVFTYDNLNRLTSSQVTNLASWTSHPLIEIDYDAALGNSMGNITQKTDVGSYKYGTKLHAVRNVTNPEGVISQNQQDITYTPFRKAETVTEDGFEQEFTYDASFQRVKTVLKDNSALQNTRYYLDGYESNIEPVYNDENEIHYISGGDGVCALVEFNTLTNLATFHYVYKDHLGSLIAVTDNAGNVEAEQNFDAWGRMRDPEQWDYINIPAQPAWLYRGYTGHEHMPEFTVINMNGRMYDPILGRMMAPDNYVGNASSTQGYNRFTYANNNPLAYTDPDGQLPFLVVAGIVGASVFGTANLAAQLTNGEINSFKDGLEAFGAGAIAGGVLGAACGVGLGVPVLGTAIKAMGVASGVSTGFGVLAGLADGLNGDWSTLENTGKLFLGNFYLDRNRSFGGQIWQGISRFTWEGLNNFTGYNYSQWRNSAGGVDRVDYFGGATFATNENSSSTDGVSLGNFININIKQEIRGNFRDRVTSDPLFMHEYGHTFDSQIFGLSYLPIVGIPSLISAHTSERISGSILYTHDLRWYEMSANRHAAQYFGKHFNVDWTFFEPPFNTYPRRR